MILELGGGILEVLVHMLLGELDGRVFGEELGVRLQHSFSELLGEDVPQGRRRYAPLALLPEERLHARVEHLHSSGQHSVKCA